MLGWWIYLATLALMSVTTFAMYAWDKRQARRGAWRVAESTLQALALLGGWPGALTGRHLLRHKTRKGGFTAILYLIVAVHVAAVVAAMWLL